MSLNTIFAEHVTEALTAFRVTANQCAGLCAYISTRLSEAAVPNRVALGSLICDGVTTFRYQRLFSTRRVGVLDWDGHAWLEFPSGIIGEPSLLRTAKSLPDGSPLRRSLDQRGLLGRGAFLVPADEALRDYGLDYQVRTYLDDEVFMPLIGGLMAMNGMIRLPVDCLDPGARNDARMVEPN